jgi:hypothetical protein
MPFSKGLCWSEYWRPRWFGVRRDAPKCLIFCGESVCQTISSQIEFKRARSISANKTCIYVFYQGRKPWASSLLNPSTSAKVSVRNSQSQATRN